MVVNGATTMWENWNGDRYNAAGSRNHIMFGSNSAWYFQTLAGIQMASSKSVAYDHIVINPYIPSSSSPSLTSVSATIGSIRGPISVSWDLPSPHFCGFASENSILNLHCIGGTITSIDFASFGTPTGSCGNYSIGSCNSPNSMSAVSSLCLNQASCSIPANNANFGGDPCYGTAKSLAVQVSGCPIPIVTLSVTIPVGSDAVVGIPTLNQVSTSFSILESGVTFWSNGQFVPGVPGISSATVNGNVVNVAVGSGTYSFVLLE